MRDDAGVDDHLDLLVAGVCQVGQSPHCVYQNLETAKKNNEEMNIFCETSLGANDLAGTSIWNGDVNG